MVRRIVINSIELYQSRGTPEDNRRHHESARSRFLAMDFDASLIVESQLQTTLSDDSL